MSYQGRSRQGAAAVDETAADDAFNSELSDLVREIEESSEVRLALDNAPQVPPIGASSAQTNKRQPARETIPAAQASTQGKTLQPAIVYRDKDDVKTILSQTWVMKGMLLLLIASFTGNVFMYLRRPDRIVVDGPSGRVLSINDRNYGHEEGVEFGPDRLTNQDKVYITREFTRALYQIDPSTRNRDMERALTMMVPDSAKKFARWLKEKGVLDQQKSESWQSIWTPIDVQVDANDPYTINLIGKQDITKVVNGATEHEVKQLRITIKLVADSKGRADRNLRSGFLISYIDTKELNAPANPSASPTAAGDNTTPVTSQTTPVTALQDQNQ